MRLEDIGITSPINRIKAYFIIKVLQIDRYWYSRTQRCVEVWHDSTVWVCVRVSGEWPPMSTTLYSHRHRRSLRAMNFNHHFISLLLILSRWCHFNWISDFAISKSIKKKLSIRTYVCTIYIFIYFKHKLLLLQVHFFILYTAFIQNVSQVHNVRENAIAEMWKNEKLIFI